MKKVLLATAGLAALGLASASQASVIATLIPKGAPISAAATASGYSAYVVRLTSDQGVITAFDAQSGSNGITGPLLQRWTDPDSPDGTATYSVKSITNTANNGANNNVNLDSHLLPTTYVGSIGFDESIGAGVFPAPGSSVGGGVPNNSVNVGFANTGAGGFIKGAAGLDPAVQSTIFDLAYIVIPNSDQGTHGTVIVATSTGTPVTVTIPTAVVPEPATLGLAAVAGLGMIRRRRAS
jgi:hypothetical protein